MNFSKSFKNRNILILIDKGTKRDWTVLSIGLDNPSFFLSINDLFLLKNNYFKFNTINEAELKIKTILNLIRKVVADLESS